MKLKVKIAETDQVRLAIIEVKTWL